MLGNGGSLIFLLMFERLWLLKNNESVKQRPGHGGRTSFQNKNLEDTQRKQRKYMVRLLDGHIKQARDNHANE
jgi:hypothetical protein